MNSAVSGKQVTGHLPDSGDANFQPRRFLSHVEVSSSSVRPAETPGAASAIFS